jgi:hypothetical protein
VDAIWVSEPSAPVALTAQQKHAWRKAEVKRVVEAELEGRMKRSSRSSRPPGKN